LADGYVELNRQAEKKRSLLRGRTIINCYFESSTRTRTSFEVAGKRLDGDVINMSVPASSMVKGETQIHTAMTLNAMHRDVLASVTPNRGRFICSPRRSIVRSSMPATAATSTRPRRCSTR
jgi:aspartate carbamoyltransferase catalytic subunit